MLAACGLVYFWAALGQSRRLGKEAELLVVQVEAYRTEKGALPSNLEALGRRTTLEGPLHYVRRGEETYLVWFGTMLGSSVTWDSRTGEWREGG